MLRQKHLRESENRLKELRTIEPLHHKIEKRYMDTYELPELESRKKALEELRNLPYHSKTDIDDIKHHSIEYEKLRKQRLEERIKNRMDTIKSYSNYSMSNYRTKTFENMSMREEMERSLEEEKRIERLRMINNTKQYAKNVIDLHKPAISRRKQEEMRHIIDEMNRSPKEKINRIRYERSDNSILNYHGTKSINGRGSQMRDVDGNLVSNLSTISKADESISSPSGLNKHDRRGSEISQYNDLDTVPERVAKYESALNPPKGYQPHNRSKTTIRGTVKKNLSHDLYKDSDSKKPTQFVKYDYLAKQRNKRMEEGGYDYKEQEFWKDDIENPEKSAIDKFHEIKAKTENLERKAKLKESQIASAHSSNPLKQSEEVSSMYIDAIKAKAALLANL